MRDIEHKRAYARERYVWLKSRGICVFCATSDASVGSVLCPECWERKRNHTNPPTEAKREHDRVGARKLRKTRINLRLCVACGIKLSELDGTRCDKCAKKHNASGRACRRKGETREQLLAKGICVMCHKAPHIDNRTICQQCLDRGRKQIQLMNSKRGKHENNKKKD